MDDRVFISLDDDKTDKGGNYTEFITIIFVGEKKINQPKLPHPWKAKTAVMRRPRERVAANSEEMMALRG